MYKDADQTIAALEKETAQYYERINSNRRIDESFSRPDDEPLTKDEIAAIDAYWGKYSFAYPNIDYKSFQTFRNRSGRFDVRHCPGSIRTSVFSKHFVDKKFDLPFQHKAMLPFLFPDIHQPKAVALRMNGIYYDSNYRPITLQKLSEICCAHVKDEGDLIFKTVGSSGGKGVTILSQNNALEFTGNIPGGGHL